VCGGALGQRLCFVHVGSAPVSRVNPMEVSIRIRTQSGQPVQSGLMSSMSYAR
jgi:hypothetical protein